jgi:hypothetical protein
MSRSSLMTRAWRIFRQTYRYQGRGKGIPFASIGRKAFAWALREAWRQVREEARIAAIPADVKAARAAQIGDQLADLVWIDNVRQAEATRAVLTAELRQIGA